MLLRRGAVAGLSAAVLAVAAVKLLVHLYAGRHYGYFVDELYYLACSHRGNRAHGKTHVRNHFLSMNAFEPLSWLGWPRLAVGIVKTGKTKCWIWFGVLAGLGLERRFASVQKAGIVYTRIRCPTSTSTSSTAAA